VDRNVWNKDEWDIVWLIYDVLDHRQAFSREKRQWNEEKEKFKRTRSKSRASSRIRSLSNDDKSLLCFQRGNEDLNSGNDTTPGHVSSLGVPSVLRKWLITLLFFWEQYFLYRNIRKSWSISESPWNNGRFVYISANIQPTDQTSTNRNMYITRICFRNTYLDMNNVKHRVRLQVLDTIM
jgi:hypothetical protein